MRKEVEEFLECVAKEQPQLLDANADEQGFNDVLKRLIHPPSAPKQKRHKRDITKSRRQRKQ
jgi:hypothetical protein